MAGFPAHPLVNGVTVNLLEIDTFDRFVVVKAGTIATPLKVPKPTAGLSCTH
jgi:hypothetical protein